MDFIHIVIFSLPQFLREQCYHILIGGRNGYVVSLNIDVKMKQDFNNSNIRINHSFMKISAS